jgi:tRNA nucleotidyltransferase (CCA-adding enzyme)
LSTVEGPAGRNAGAGQASLEMDRSRIAAEPPAFLPIAVDRMARRIGEAAAALGLQAYLVGGPVRDLLLGRDTVDLDIMAEGDAIRLARGVGRELGGTVRAHPRFGTASVGLPDGGEVDFASARKERYLQPGALPDVEPGSIDEDLQRRDFTVNAMALHLHPARFGELLDPYGGRSDLEAHLIRVLHDGSFLDDPTRLIRAVRFEQRLCFLLEKRTAALACEAVGNGALGTLTPERLREELDRLFEDPAAVPGILRLQELGVWDWFAPGLRIDAGLIGRIPEALAWWRQASGQRAEARLPYLAAILASLGAEGAAHVAGQRLRLPPAQREMILAALEAAEALRGRWSVGQPSPSEAAAALRPQVDALVYVYASLPDERVRRILDRFMNEWRAVRLEISGDDLIAAGWRPGPALGAALRATLDARLDAKIAGRDEELQFAQAWLEKAGEQRE